MLVLPEWVEEVFQVGSMLVLVADFFFGFPNMEGGYVCLEFHV